MIDFEVREDESAIPEGRATLATRPGIDTATIDEGAMPFVHLLREEKRGRGRAMRRSLLAI